MLEIIKIVEKKRFTDSTNMNSTSSRTNAIIEMKLMTKRGDNVHLAVLRFIDLAGSERVDKAGLDSGPTYKAGSLSLAATMNNL